MGDTFLNTVSFSGEITSTPQQIAFQITQNYRLQANPKNVKIPDSVQIKSETWGMRENPESGCRGDGGDLRQDR